jgi:hypothetical protein
MTLLGINRRGWVAWPTTSRVTRFEPGRAVAWKTRESGATWTYELEPTGTGTRLTGRRDQPEVTLGAAERGPIRGRAAGRDRQLADDIRATLDQIKAAVEAGSPARR